MGRMSDARKRAQQKKGKPQPAAAPAEAEVVSAEDRPAGGWVSREESLVFPADPGAEAAPAMKISLPSSGLAEDILARAEAAAVSPVALERAVPAAVAASPAAPSAPEEAVSKAHNISF